jgi:tetratricopeptide (TPR) repeat protein
VLAGYEKTSGPDHPYTLTAVNNLALTLQNLGRLDEAESLYRRALAGKEIAAGPDHRDTLTSVHNLADLLQLRGRYDESERLFRWALAGKEKALGPEHPSTLNSAKALATLLYDTRRYDEAAALFERALRGYEKRPEAALAALESRSMLGLALLGAGRPAEAEPHLLTGYDGLAKQKTLGAANRNRLRWVAAGLVEVYERAGQSEKAGRWRTQLAALPPETAPSPRAK